ncbi:hypothetical protein LCGC14_0914620 [marine sediment metagenome]|uniref:Uncharacterized protein n=1 Tax=marine sediment metagenome TaxID=412755 RepID=A0A0F9NXD1_9ZZZZ
MQNTIFSPIAASKFIVRNRSQKASIIFNQKIGPGRSYDLMTIPHVSEADIQHSLLKGTLRNKLSVRELEVTGSNINLVQYSEEFTAFLQSVGITSGTSPIGVTGVTDIAELSQINDEVIATGTAISVATVLDTFLLDKASTAAVDGITIAVTKSMVGRWVRSETFNSYWGNQFTWYIDADNGNDENKGDTSLTALATFAECTRRMGARTYRQPVTINILSDINEGDSVILAFCPGFLTIQGVDTTIITGTLTSIIQWDHDPSDGYVVAGRITDTALSGDWSVAGPGGTSLIDRKIVLTDGPNAGSYAFIIEDSGSAKEAYVGPWMSENTWAEILPTTDTAYKVVQLPAFLDRYQIIQQNFWVYLKNLRFATPNQYWPSLETNGSCYIFGCIFDGTTSSRNSVMCGPARGMAFLNSYFKSGIDLRNAAVTFIGSTFKGLSALYVFNAYIGIEQPVVMFNTIGEISVQLQKGSHMHIANSGALGVVCLGAQTNGAVVDVLDSSSVHLFDSGSSMYSIGGNTGVGLKLSSDGRVTWEASDASTKFLFASDSDFNIGGTAKTIAELNTVGFMNPSNGAKVVPTE